MPDNEIPPAEQSVANMVDMYHNIAEAHAPHGTSVGKIIAPPPDIEILYKNKLTYDGCCVKLLMMNMQNVAVVASHLYYNSRRV
ncbi:MAG: hypothetical protein IJ728_04955 [Selenomonadaceae bacterium]|nr:hypothetical protein [Selenomonadaceae bacterium]